MATELSNYDNDYRLRYRTSTAADISGVGIDGTYADYNVVPLPDETDYGLYAEGTGTAADPFDSEAWGLAAAASFAGQVTFPKNDGLGAIEGRYSLEFTDEGDGAAGFNIPRSATPPASPSEGNLWFDTVNLALMIYFNDGNSTQWVAAS